MEEEAREGSLHVLSVRSSSKALPNELLPELGQQPQRTNSTENGASLSTEIHT
jgi:hypothetical protein